MRGRRRQRPASRRLDPSAAAAGARLLQEALVPGMLERTPLFPARGSNSHSHSLSPKRTNRLTAALGSLPEKYALAPLPGRDQYATGLAGGSRGRGLRDRKRRDKERLSPSPRARGGARARAKGPTTQGPRRRSSSVPGPRLSSLVGGKAARRQQRPSGPQPGYEWLREEEQQGERSPLARGPFSKRNIRSSCIPAAGWDSIEKGRVNLEEASVAPPRHEQVLLLPRACLRVCVCLTMLTREPASAPWICRVATQLGTWRPPA